MPALCQPGPADMPKSAPDSLRERILAKQAELVAFRDQLRLQLNGAENQLYLIDLLLHPEADQEASPDTPPPDPPGTI